GLVVGSRLPSLPSEETRLRSQIAGPWCAWERSLAAVGRPPTEPGGPVRMWREGEPGPLPECIAATGWSESRNLVDALMALFEVRQLIRGHWGVQAFAGGQSWSVITADGRASSVNSGPECVPLHKPADWPPPVPHAWLEQARHALDQVREVLGRESALNGR